MSPLQYFWQTVSQIGASRCAAKGRSATLRRPRAIAAWLVLAALAGGCASARTEPCPCDCASERPATQIDRTDVAVDDSARDAWNENGADWSALARENPAELERLLGLLQTQLEDAAPPGWRADVRLMRDRLPFQWEGRAGSAIEVSWKKSGETQTVQRFDPRTGRYVRAAAAPQFVRYLYYSLDAGFGEPKNRYIRPDRIYGVTRDFVIIQPSDATGRADFAADEIQPLFDRAFGVSEAASQEFSVRLNGAPSAEEARAVARENPNRTAAIIASPRVQSDYQLWVRTLHDIR